MEKLWSLLWYSSRLIFSALISYYIFAHFCMASSLSIQAYFRQCIPLRKRLLKHSKNSYYICAKWMICRLRTSEFVTLYTENCLLSTFLFLYQSSISIFSFYIAPIMSIIPKWFPFLILINLVFLYLGSTKAAWPLIIKKISSIASFSIKIY